MTTYGPRTRTISFPWPGYPNNRKFWYYQQWYVQKPITSAPMPYQLDIWQCKSSSQQWDGVITPDPVDAPNERAAYNVQTAWGNSPNAARTAHVQSIQKAYGKFKDAVYGETAQWGVNLAEHKQAVDLIAAPAIRLRKAWTALRAGRLDKFRFALGITQRGRYVTVGNQTYYDKTLPLKTPKYIAPRLASNAWLYYHFGWEPLVQDIYNSVKILEDPFPPKLVKARGSATNAEFQTAPLIKDGSLRYGWDTKYVARTHMQAKVLLQNKNLHRATQLGVVNPASIAWELVPFSFVVDWFIPVGQFLDSWTDFSGLTFTESFTTRSLSYKAHNWSTQWWTTHGSWVLKDNTCQGVRLQRTLGLTALPFPVPKAFKGFSIVRGATAIALLIGALRG